MARKSKGKLMDAVVVGSIAWAEARKAAYDMAAKLQGEVQELHQLIGLQDAYSPVAWLGICQHLRSVTDGMTVMRLLAQGKTPEQITSDTGIMSGSIAAYKAWNSIYRSGIRKTAEHRIHIKGRTVTEQQADVAFLRACGIDFNLVPREGDEEVAHE